MDTQAVRSTFITHRSDFRVSDQCLINWSKCLCAISNSQTLKFKSLFILNNLFDNGLPESQTHNSITHYILCVIDSIFIQRGTCSIVDMHYHGLPMLIGSQNCDGWGLINTLRAIQDGCHFQDNISQCIFLNGNVWILIMTSLKFVPYGLINNIPALVPIMAWCQPGNKPLSEPMMVSLLIHISYALLGLNELSVQIPGYMKDLWWW